MLRDSKINLCLEKFKVRNEARSLFKGGGTYDEMQKRSGKEKKK